MSIVRTNGAVRYELTPEQLLLCIAKDLEIDPARVDVSFRVSMVGDMFDRNLQPTFTGCTVSVRPEGKR